MEFEFGNFQTLEELFDRGCSSCFHKFKNITNGIIYGLDPYNQMYLIDIDTIDTLGEYYQYELVDIVESDGHQRPIIKVTI